MSHVYGNVCLNLTGKLVFIQHSQVTEQKAHLVIYSRLVSVLMWDKSTSDYTKTANAARKALRHCSILNRTKAALPVLMDVLFLLLSTDCAKIYRYKNSTGASPVVQWIMSVKITGWSSEYTNRMCHGGHMGFFQPGDLPPCSSCRQIYHVGVKGGKPTEEWELSVWVGWGGGFQRATRRQVCFYVFSFLPFKKQGDLQVAYWGSQVHKATRRELQTHVWRVMRSQGADRC